MALVLADRIRETTTTTSTGAYTLAGAENGFETFATIGNGNTTYYCCTDGVDFEIGIGTYTLSGTTLDRTAVLQSSNSDSAVSWANGTRSIFCTQPAEKAVFLDASGNMPITNNATIGGTLGVTGVLTGTSLDISGDIDIDGTSNLDIVDIDGAVNMATTLLVTGETTLQTHLNMGDGDIIKLGASADLQISHDASNSLISDTGTGALLLRGDAVAVQSTAGESMATFTEDGAATLYYDNAAKLATASGGVTVTGTVVADGVTLGDAESILLGASSDMQIIHDGSNSIIADNGTGNLVLRSNATAVEIDFNTDETSALFNHNGSVELYHDNSKKFETTSGGVTVTGEVAATSLDISGDIDVDGTTNLDVVDIDGAVDMATTLQVDGVATFTGRDIHSGGITIANAGQIGSVGDLDAIAIASNGVVTFSQIPVLPANSIDSDVYIDGSIDTAHIANLQITTGLIAADAITAAKIADDVINSEHYAAGSIDTEHIADSQITVGKMAANSVDSDQYVDGSIDTAHIANLQITTGLIAADAITAAKIADDAIDSEHYTDGSIDNAHLADDAVGADELASNAVVTASIVDANVTLAKIANQAANTVLVRDANSSGVVSAKAVATTQILIGDGTGFTAAALSGDVTMTNAGAVTIAATSVEGSMLNNNVISGQTALTSGLALTDELFVSDAGTLKRMDVSVLTAVTDDNATALAIALG